MHTILGAGGTIGNELARELVARGEKVRLVRRHARPVAEAAEVRPADLTDATGAIEAVRGSRIVYLLAGLKYSARVWRESWPRIMRNTIEACKRAGGPLVFFDNVYMYGRVGVPARPTVLGKPLLRLAGLVDSTIAPATRCSTRVSTRTFLIRPK